MSYKEQYTEGLRKNFLKYSRKVFQFLPDMKNPRVLDLGCGSGSLTIELANHFKGDIFAIDINQLLLERLSSKISGTELTTRIKIKKMDLINNDFPDEYFDFIWEEGVIQIIGYKKSLEACHRILKDSGYLILGQAISTMSRNHNIISSTGFQLIKQINWPKHCWWTEYYEPLEKLINENREGKKKATLIKNIRKVEAEVRWVKENLDESDTAHFILQKREA